MVGPSSRAEAPRPTNPHRLVRTDRRRDGGLAPSDACGTHSTQLLLQFADLIAEPRGEFEAQLRGRGPHLSAQILDQRFEVGGRLTDEVQRGNPAARADAGDSSPPPGAGAAATRPVEHFP